MKYLKKFIDGKKITAPFKIPDTQKKEYPF